MIDEFWLSIKILFFSSLNFVTFCYQPLLTCQLLTSELTFQKISHFWQSTGFIMTEMFFVFAKIGNKEAEIMPPKIGESRFLLYQRPNKPLYALAAYIFSGCNLTSTPHPQ
jgi:hypothetical protein